MSEYVLSNVKWGGPALGQSGGDVLWSFALYNWGGFSFDAAISEEPYRNLVRKAFEAWESVANINFTEVVDSEQAQFRLGWDGIDGENGTVGESRWVYQNNGSAVGTLTGAEIRFDTGEAWSLDENYPGGRLTNFYAVALHEIGHALGLGHTTDPSTIMYPQVTDVIDLAAGDIAGAQIIYGAAGGAGTATNGDDTFRATAGNDDFNGLNGLDTVLYNGRSAEYMITVNATSIVVTDSASRDNLVGIERIVFADQSIAFDVDGNAGQAYRLYQAALDRTPDKIGLGYWIQALDDGNDLNWVAQNFIDSKEFQNTYGNPSTVTNGQFTDLIYNNVLNRDADDKGYSYWTQRLDAGTTRAEMLAEFSESGENQSNVASVIDDGIWYV